MHSSRRCTVRSSSHLWGGLPRGGVCAQEGGVSAWGVSTTPPRVNRITDACENITLRNYVAGGKNANIAKFVYYGKTLLGCFVIYRQLREHFH